MAKTPFRFVHASDLHLEMPIASVLEMPEHLENRFLTAARIAAERLFQMVRAEEVDFLILSGGVLNPGATGPAGPILLVEQFRQLAEMNIPVYWAGGRYDGPEDWPSAIFLPDNVHLFRSGTTEEFVYLKSGIPIARLIGISRNNVRRRIRLSDFSPDPAGLFSIAVAHGTLDPERLLHHHIDYWALGGTNRQTYQSPDRKSISFRSGETTEPYGDFRSSNSLSIDGGESVIHEVPYTVHYPGSTLGRSPEDIGVHGATLVEVHPGERPIMSQLATAPIRWTTERVFIEANSSLDDLRTEMTNRLRNLRSLQNDYDLIVSWIVEASGGTLIDSLRNDAFANRILEEQRREFGFGETITWPLSLKVPLPDTLRPNLYEQKTILGDYLRSIRHYQDNPEEGIDLEGFLPKEFAETESYDELLLSEIVEIPRSENEEEEQYPSEEKKPPKRRIRHSLQAEILKESALLGLDLLSGEKKGEG